MSYPLPLIATGVILILGLPNQGHAVWVPASLATATQSSSTQPKPAATLQANEQDSEKRTKLDEDRRRLQAALDDLKRDEDVICHTTTASHTPVETRP